MKNIHWLGAGLSSVPGIRRLATKNLKLTVWNRTLSKAEYSINHVQSPNVLAKTFKFEDFTSSLQEGDIVVSQLPASMHIKIAKICLEKKCHFASTSYISPAIEELDQQVRDKKLIFINEIGLDPGIDHFFSHLLVAELQKQNLKKFSVSYKSFCGGIPAIPNDFKYKFSWSPIGVIKALNNSAIFIDNYENWIIEQQAFVLFRLHWRDWRFRNPPDSSPPIGAARCPQASVELNPSSRARVPARRS